MDILIDPRPGSKPLATISPLLGVATLSDRNLPHGDVLITGNGPQEKKIFVCCEVKRIDDFISSIQSNRLRATQIETMLQHGDYFYLFIYGKQRKHSATSQWQTTYDGKKWFRTFGGKLADPSTRRKFITKLELFYNIHVRVVDTIQDVAQQLYELAETYSKPFRSHSSLRGFDTSSLPSRNQTKGMRKLWKDNAHYNRGLLASILPNVGITGAEIAGKHFTTPLEMVLDCVLTDSKQRVYILNKISQYVNDPSRNPWLSLDTVGDITFNQMMQFWTEESDK